VCRSGAASSEMAALAQSSIASLSNQNVFALDQVQSVTFWISPFTLWICCVYSQTSRSNYLGYLHVLKYLLFIVIILNQKGVMQTDSLAEV